MNVDGHVLLVIAGLRLGRTAGAAQVGNDNSVTLGEQRHDRMPHVTGFGIAVQQNDWAALAADEVAQSNSVDLGKALSKTSLGCAGLDRARGRHRRQRGEQFFSRKNRMRERRSVQLVRRAHHLAIECRRCVLHQRDVIAEFHREAGRRLDASVRQQTDHDDVFDAVLFELLIEIGIGKAALGPMLLDDNVAFLGHEVRMPFTAPGSFGKSLPFTRGDLAWVWVSPLSVITRLPAMMRHDEKLNLCSARCRNDLAQMIEKVLFLGDLFEQGPKLAAFAEKIIVGVDEQQAGSV